MACGVHCVDYMNDPANCGGCGAEFRCTPTQRCSSGRCEDTCSGPDLKQCDDYCVSIETDPYNCGDCGTVCGPGEVCQNGYCICSEPMVYCRHVGKCVDLNFDTNNCGMCGNVCPIGWLCTEGLCVGPDTNIECSEGATVCGDNTQYCSDLEYDPENCGSCGSRCSEDSFCDWGNCTLGLVSCAYNESECAGQCVNLSNDNENCGRCGFHCVGSEYCQNGVCHNSEGLPDEENADGEPERECKGGSLKECGTYCADLKNDSSHCGTCYNKCEQAEVCLAGICVDTSEISQGTASAVTIPGTRDKLTMTAHGDEWSIVDVRKVHRSLEPGEIYSFVPKKPESRISINFNSKEVLNLRGTIVLDLSIPNFTINAPSSGGEWSINVSSERLREMISRVQNLPVVPQILQMVTNASGEFTIYKNANPLVFDLRDNPEQEHPEIDFSPTTPGKTNTAEINLAGLGLVIEKLKVVFDPVDFRIESAGKITVSNGGMKKLFKGSVEASEFIIRPFSTPPLSFGGTKLVLSRLHLGGVVIEGSDDGSNPQKDISVVFDIESGCFGIIPSSVGSCTEIVENFDDFLINADLEEFSRSLVIRTSPDGPWKFGAGFLCGYDENARSIIPLIIGGSVSARPGIPIAQTGLAFVGGSIVLADFNSDFPTIDLRTEIEPITPPLNEVIALRDLGATISPVHYMEAGGRLDLFGSEVAIVQVALEYNPSAWTGITMEGDLTLPSRSFPVIDARALLMAGKDNASTPPITLFYGSMDGLLQIPEMPECGWNLLCTAAVTLIGEDNFPFQISRVKQSLDTRIWDDGYSMDLSSSIVIAGQEIGVIVHAKELFEKKLRNAFEIEIPSGTPGTLGKSEQPIPIQTVGAFGSVQLEDNLQSVLFLVDNTDSNGLPVDFSLIRIQNPEGNVYRLSSELHKDDSFLFKRGREYSVIIVTNPGKGGWVFSSIGGQDFSFHSLPTSLLPEVTIIDIVNQNNEFSVELEPTNTVNGEYEICFFMQRGNSATSNVPIGCNQHYFSGDMQTFKTIIATNNEPAPGEYTSYVTISQIAHKSNGQLQFKRQSERRYFQQNGQKVFLELAGVGTPPVQFAGWQDRHTNSIFFQWQPVDGATGYIIYVDADGNDPDERSPHIVISSDRKHEFILTEDFLAKNVQSSAFLRTIKKAIGGNLIAHIRSYRKNGDSMMLSAPSDVIPMPLDNPLKSGNIPHIVSVPPDGEVEPGQTYSYSIAASDYDLLEGDETLTFYVASDIQAVWNKEFSECSSLPNGSACISVGQTRGWIKDNQTATVLNVNVAADASGGPLSFWLIVQDETGQYDYVKFKKYIAGLDDSRYECDSCVEQKCFDGDLYCYDCNGLRADTLYGECVCGCEFGQCQECGSVIDGDVNEDVSGNGVDKMGGRGCKSSNPYALLALVFASLMLLKKRLRRRREAWQEMHS